jgi:hypothetical protein
MRSHYMARAIALWWNDASLGNAINRQASVPTIKSVSSCRLTNSNKIAVGRSTHPDNSAV